MAIAIHSAGTKVFYGVESTAGTIPTTGYVEIPLITELPDMNSQPETIEVTPLSSEKYKQYIPGLKDMGGALTLTANFTQELADAWDVLMTAYETATADNKAVWFMFVIPNISKVFAFTAEPTALGFSGASVNSALTQNLYITPTNEPEFIADPRV